MCGREVRLVGEDAVDPESDGGEHAYNERQGKDSLFGGIGEDRIDARAGKAATRSSGGEGTTAALPIAATVGTGVRDGVKGRAARPSGATLRRRQRGARPHRSRRLF